MLKNLFDLIVASAALLIVSPVLLGIAVLVKLEDGGPVVYRGLRVGQADSPVGMVRLTCGSGS